MGMETDIGHGVRDVNDPGGIVTSEDLRCRRCGELVRLEGSPLVPEQLRKAVHAATGIEAGPDGHPAAPIAVSAAVDPFTSEEWRLLLLGWDEAYDFAHDPRQPEPFSAARRDKLATVLRAPTPEALRNLVTEDYASCPVARKPAP